MVSPRANNANLDTVSRVPLEGIDAMSAEAPKAQTNTNAYPCIAIEDIHEVPGVEVINSALTIDLKGI